MSLVDVIAPPDFILNSPIGRADGEVKSFAKPQHAFILTFQMLCLQVLHVMRWGNKAGENLHSSCSLLKTNGIKCTLHLFSFFLPRNLRVPCMISRPPFILTAMSFLGRGQSCSGSFYFQVLQVLQRAVLVAPLSCLQMRR